MKNLNKKIGIIMLSGLALSGGSLVGGVSVAHAALPHEIIKEVPINKLKKSQYEYNGKLAPRPLDPEDLNIVKLYEKKFHYRIFKARPSKKHIEYLAELKPHLLISAKSFINVYNFLQYMEEEGQKLEGFYNFDIRGVKYIFQFGVKK